MNKEIKTRWINALTSGKYVQGKNALAYDGKFCCLGVLCELAVEDKVIEREEYVGYFYYDMASTTPTQKVQDWAGIYQDYCYELAAMNDKGKTFEDIAKIIEENL